MADILQEQAAFDLQLAIECAEAYSKSTGLGCTVSDLDGAILHESGFGCGSCIICSAAGLNRSNCMRVHAYGMSEAERFGGKYIYFCPMGLTCFVSPIVGREGSAAKITVGPFLMVDLEDYIAFDLEQNMKLSPSSVSNVVDALENIPCESPDKVNALSILLFMAVGFLNDVSAVNRMRDVQDASDIQGQITAYILELKGGDPPSEYPLKTEKALLASIVDSDKKSAQRLLNELLGHILFSSGGDFSRIKSRIFELLVLMSRAAVDAGASPDSTFTINHDFFLRAQNTTNIDELCFLLAGVMNRYIDSIFDFSDLRHADVIHKAVQHLRRHYTEKVTLDEVAQMVYLSPSYFSKVFKKETGMSFNSYLNHLRIEKSKVLLLKDNLKLVDIAAHVGFEDQSYFTKVFKRITGVSPNRFRESGGRIDRQLVKQNSVSVHSGKNPKNRAV